MNYEQVFYEHEKRFRDINEAIFRIFIKSFEGKCSSKLRKLIQDFENQTSNYCEIFWQVYSHLINHPSSDINLLFNLLKRFDFSLNQIILSNVRLLGKMVNNSLSKEVHDKLLNSPIIDEIEYKDKIVHIYSQVGEYKFHPLNVYFDFPHPLWLFLATHEYPNNCHHGSWELINRMPEGNL